MMDGIIQKQPEGQQTMTNVNIRPNVSAILANISVISFFRCRNGLRHILSVSLLELQSYCCWHARDLLRPLENCWCERVLSTDDADKLLPDKRAEEEMPFKWLNRTLKDQRQVTGYCETCRKREVIQSSAEHSTKIHHGITTSASNQKTSKTTLRYRLQGPVSVLIMAGTQDPQPRHQRWATSSSWRKKPPGLAGMREPWLRREVLAGWGDTVCFWGVTDAKASMKSLRRKNDSASKIFQMCVCRRGFNLDFAEK